MLVLNYISSIQLAFIIHFDVLWFIQVVEHKTYEVNTPHQEAQL
jgi:hypothetical protein